MRLHLLRHSLTSETGKRLSSLDPDIALSPQGQAMAAAVASMGTETRLVMPPHSISRTRNSMTSIICDRRLVRYRDTP